MEKTVIICKKDLYNCGKCFTKGRKYIVKGNAKSPAGLLDLMIEKNDMGEPHTIGSWWRNFTILNKTKQTFRRRKIL